MPGKYPKTQEEREAAAKKYGLRVEDYEPHPDDGEGYGDYPKLPLKCVEGRDPYEDYDEPTLRRNFNEPVMGIGGGSLFPYLSIVLFCIENHLGYYSIIVRFSVIFIIYCSLCFINIVM